MKFANNLLLAVTIITLSAFYLSAQNNWIWAEKINGNNDINLDGISIDNADNLYWQIVFEGDITIGSKTFSSAGGSDGMIIKYNSNGDTIWSAQYGGVNDETPGELDIDASANIYISGFFSDDAVFDGTTLDGVTGNNIYIAKYSTNGSLSWAINAGNATDYLEITDILIDESDNILITGLFEGTLTIGTEIAISNNYQNPFIAKFDNTGNIVWLKYYKSTNDNVLFRRISCCKNEGLYIIGHISDTLFVEDDTLVSTSAGTFDGILLKVLDNGNVDWIRQFGDNSRIKGTTVCSDTSGNAIIAGIFETGILIDSTDLGLFDSQSYTSAGEYDVFIAKYDKNGLLKWFIANGGAELDNPNTITCNNQYIQISGIFENSPVWNEDTLIASDKDAFIIKLDMDGNIIGAKQITGTGDDRGLEGDMDSNGNHYLTGFFKSNSLVLDTISISNSSGTKDAFVSKISPIINVDLIPTQVTCPGNDDGTITLDVYGEEASNCTFAWSTTDGSGLVADDQNQTGLTAGTYTVTVSYGDYGAEVIESIEVKQLDFTSSITNVTCNGGSDGEATIAGSNGTEPYTYAWETGGTDATISSLEAGWYTFTLTDATPCTIIDSVEVTEPDTLTYMVTGYTPESAGGASDGEIIITPVPGVPPYTYAWEGLADTDSTISNLTAAWYKFTITDACESLVDSVEIVVGNPLTYSLTYQSNVTCYGDNDGEAIVTPAGGLPPYSYNWSNGSTDSTAANLTAGRYYFTVSDTYLSLIDSVDISQPDDLTFVINKTNVTCNGGSDGEVTMTASGGVPPYTYLWSTGSTDATISSLSAGDYPFTLTDACDTIVSMIQISEPDTLGFTVSVTDISCNGENDGVVIVTPTGGVPPYSYAWDPNPDTDSIISNLTEGDYYFTITDACESVHDTAHITEPAALTYVKSATDISCNGANDGVATVTPSGGVLPYTYFWSETGDTDSTITGLAQGWYHFTLTDACVTFVDSVQITEPEVFNYVKSYSDITCNGANDGIATVTPSGGVLPYDYLWSPGGETDSTITGLSAGWYYVTLSDACVTIDDSIQITEPDTLGYTTTVTDISCFGADDGTATINPAGGVQPYTYIWDGGETNNVITGLSAGWYYFTLSDACETYNDSVQIVESPEFTISITSSTNITCFGENDGEAIVTPAGGVLPYSYIWSSGHIDSTAANLYAGWYYVTVSDACGSLVDSIELTQPDSLTYTISITPPLCPGDSNGTATITPVTGLPPYSYEWSTGATDSTITGLADGTYYVTLTDACFTIIATVVVTEPDVITPSFSISQSYCSMSTGEIDLSVTGGTPPYTYEWSNSDLTEDIDSISAGWYTVTVTDNNGCFAIDSTQMTDEQEMALILEPVHTTCAGGDGRIDLTPFYGYPPYTYLWSNGKTTQDIDSLDAGTYLVTVTDIVGCTATDSTSIIQGDNIVITFFDSDPTCFGINDGSVSISVNGGTPPYSYIWSDSSTTQNIDSLAAGFYTVTVTDVNNCTAIDSTILNDPQLITLNMFTTDVSCYGLSDGAITLIVTGGTAPNTYLWNDASSSTTPNINDLPSGTYTVTVTDYSGCVAIDSATVGEPEELGAIIGGNDTICFNATNGSIILNPFGGTYPYYYTWSTGAATPDIYNLSAGTYYFTITDNYDCSYTGSKAVVQTDSIGVTHTSIDISCYGYNNGTINTSVSGGTPPYSYTWYDSEGITSYTTGNLNEISAEIYIVKVTDSIGCTGYDTITITEPDQMLVYELISDILCYGDSTGKIELAVYGGIPQYNYLWSNGDTDSISDNLTAGYYTVTVSDQNSCTYSETYTISEPYKSIKVTADITNVSCRDYADGSIDIDIEYGTPPYFLYWSNTETTSLIENLAAGSYYLTVSDNNGCVSYETFEVEDSEFPCMEIRNAFTPNADGTNDVWNIKGIEVYPDCTVDVYNQWGNQVFHSEGYSEPWDGSKDGNEMPAGTYYYIIDLGTGDTPYTGSVTIIK